MTEQEIIKEIKKDGNIMYQLTATATFLSLYLKLVEKGLLTKKDIEDINKKTESHTEELVRKVAKRILEEYKED